MYPVSVHSLPRQRYVLDTGSFSYTEPFLRKSLSPTQASNSRSSGSDFRLRVPASVAESPGACSRASKTPSDTAANMALERRKASISSITRKESRTEEEFEGSICVMSRSLLYPIF